MPSNPIESEILEKYGNRVRIRVSGLCWQNDQLLMVNHKHLTKGDFWAPPGGGLEFGQSAHDALTREFLEEASIFVNPVRLLFTCEFIKPPLHAIELFFEVNHEQGVITTGTDPESTSANQLIEDVRYLDFNTIMSIPADERHGIFRFVKSIDDLKKLSGFYRI
ncbi:MAG TPA: NUDIX domain-containing protein [Cyclobacteriaceae bacterium]|nr:NUDIX domain-containing protein [Cyclobacteriaceae bacterium]